MRSGRRLVLVFRITCSHAANVPLELDGCACGRIAVSGVESAIDPEGWLKVTAVGEAIGP